MTDEKKAELLLDHYKDTFQIVFDHWKVRNRLFGFILAALTLMLFQLTSPNVFEELANSYIRDQIGASSKSVVDFRFLTSLLWFVLLALLVPYQQRCILIERQYKYLDQLERQLNTFLGGDYITREGTFYKQGRPKHIRHVRHLYRWVFPAILFSVTLSKLIQEIMAAWREWKLQPVVFTIADCIIALIIFYYTGRFIEYSIKRQNQSTEPQGSEK